MYELQNDEETHCVVIVSFLGAFDFGFDDSEKVLIGGWFLPGSCRRKVKLWNKRILVVVDGREN